MRYRLAAVVTIVALAYARALTAHTGPQAKTPEEIAAYVFGGIPVRVLRDGAIVHMTAGDVGDARYPYAVRSMALKSAATYFQYLFRSNPDIERAEVVQRASRIDVSGVKSSYPVLRIRLTRAKAAAISWDNFDPSNFEEIADFYWEHPDLKP